MHRILIRIFTATAALLLAGGMATGVARTAEAATTPRPAAADTSYYTIYNRHSGLYLGIAGGKNDAQAVIWPSNGAANQQWAPGGRVTGPGGVIYYQVVNKSGSCLGVGGGATNDGANVVGWTCLGPKHTDQYWECTAQGLFVNLKSQKVLGVAGQGTTKGTDVVIWANNGTPDHYWDWAAC
jgi:hypothetical protein